MKTNFLEVWLSFPTKQLQNSEYIIKLVSPSLNI